MIRVLAATGLALLLAATACSDDDEEIGPATDIERADAMDGLSREEIERAAEPMSPERAVELGIVDSTIHLEDPTVSLDTILPVQVPMDRGDTVP